MYKHCNDSEHSQVLAIENPFQIMPSPQLPKSWQSTTRQNAPSTLQAKSARVLKHTKGRKNLLQGNG